MHTDCSSPGKRGTSGTLMSELAILACSAARGLDWQDAGTEIGGLLATFEMPAGVVGHFA